MSVLASIGATTFAAVVWGSILVVVGTFGYLLYAVLTE